jgi:hypothetical protein
VANTTRSPIYQSAGFAVDPRAGRTQWGDATQRVTFFNSLNPDTKDWHVLLGTPIIAPTVNTSDFFDGFANHKFCGKSEPEDATGPFYCNTFAR